MTDGLTPPFRTVVGLIALGLAVCAGFGVAAHFFGPVSTVVTLLASFTPVFVVLAMVSAAVLAAVRFWVAALVVLIVVVVGVASQLPLYFGQHPTASAGAPKVRVLQANLRLGEADTRAVVDLVRDNGVDVLTVAELTGSAAERLSADGIEQWLPYSFLYPRYGGGGEGIYSRYPLSDTVELPGLQHSNLRATIRPTGATPVAVYALHPLPPYPEPSWRWAAELEKIGAILAEEEQSLIVGADFNSTYDHERYRRLLSTSARGGSALVDAGEYLGSGIVATFPADRWFPAVLAIDKILARGVAPISFERVDLPGSDHHGVLGDVQLEPAAP